MSKHTSTDGGTAVGKKSDEIRRLRDRNEQLEIALDRCSDNLGEECSKSAELRSRLYAVQSDLDEARLELRAVRFTANAVARAAQKAVQEVLDGPIKVFTDVYRDTPEGEYIYTGEIRRARVGEFVVRQTDDKVQQVCKGHLARSVSYMIVEPLAGAADRFGDKTGAEEPEVWDGGGAAWGESDWGATDCCADDERPDTDAPSREDPSADGDRFPYKLQFQFEIDTGPDGFDVALVVPR